MSGHYSRDICRANSAARPLCIKQSTRRREAHLMRALSRRESKLGRRCFCPRGPDPPADQLDIGPPATMWLSRLGLPQQAEVKGNPFHRVHN
jgi:hypothetical protein